MECRETRGLAWPKFASKNRVEGAWTRMPAWSPSFNMLLSEGAGMKRFVCAALLV
jgi:hypothetical protein